MKRLCTAIFLMLMLTNVSMADTQENRPIQRDAPASAVVAPTTAVKPSFGFDSGQVALALGIVIALILLLRTLAIRFFPAAITGGRGQAVKVVARCMLAPRQHVVVVQVGKRILVLGDNASQISCLCQITDADEVAGLLGQIQRDRTSPSGSPFTSWISRATDAFNVVEESELAEPNADTGELPPATGLGGLTARVRGLARQFSSTDAEV